ncbi:MAG: polysaccharide biosynthesis tyrosine autokinase [Acidocella sp.]|nr:polysaccharide biosynthesis tyrosine autokinase [Acidocella sp.]
MSFSLITGLPPAAAGPAALPEQLIILRRHRRLIILTTLALPLIAAAILIAQPASYTATGVLIYNAPAPAPGIAASPQDADALIASQSALIASLPSLRSIATQLNLAAQPEFNPPAPWWWPLPAPPPDPDRVPLAAGRALSIQVPPNSRLITVGFTSQDASLSAAAANLAIQLYLAHQREQSFANLQDSQSWLQTHQAALQSQLDATETALATARQAAGMVPGMQGDLSAETASRITASFIDAKSALAMAQARLKSATEGDAAAANAAIAPNLLPLRKEQADFSAQVQSLSRQYGPNYPDLVAAQTSLAAINAEIDAETGRELAAARAEVAADQAQVAALGAALEAARTASHAQDMQSAPIQALTGRADALRAALHAIAAQADQLAQQTALDRPMAVIVSSATPPAAPNASHRGLIVAAAAFLGLCLGILLAGLAEALDTSFRSTGDLQARLGLPCLAAVPEVSNPRFAAQDAPFSLFAEQLRALRTALTLSGSARILAITAARPGEGKTTLTVALGRALALAGVAVAVVDADIRQPSFEVLFETGDQQGLTDYLSGFISLDEMTLKDSETGLHVITAGTQAADALSLFLSPKLGALLALLRERYEIVLIDVPPAFALAETRVLARAADATLLCVQWGKTPARIVQAALQILLTANVKLAGTVLTRVDSKIHRSSGFPDAEIYQPRYGGYFRPRNVTSARLPPSQQHDIEPAERE